MVKVIALPESLRRQVDDYTQEGWVSEGEYSDSPPSTKSQEIPKPERQPKKTRKLDLGIPLH